MRRVPTIGQLAWVIGQVVRVTGQVVRVTGQVLRIAHKLAIVVQPWGILLAAVLLAITIWQLWQDGEDRVNQRVMNAWNIVTTEAQGSSGKKEALEYLNREDGLGCPYLPPPDPDNIQKPYAIPEERCWVTFKHRTPLVGIDLTGDRRFLCPGPSKLRDPTLFERTDLSKLRDGVFLERIDLRRAIVLQADFSGAHMAGAILIRADARQAAWVQANLQRADLTRGFFMGAKFCGANLHGARLTDAFFEGADFRGADLEGADLRGAHLKGADLRDAKLLNSKFGGAVLNGANLLGVSGLDAGALDGACGNGATRLPDGLSIAPCD